jgi:hypothetical protein
MVHLPAAVTALMPARTGKARTNPSPARVLVVPAMREARMRGTDERRGELFSYVESFKSKEAGRR